MPEDMPDKMPWDMSDRMPEDMPDKVPEFLPDRMPEDLPDNMPEDIPDRIVFCQAQARQAERRIQRNPAENTVPGGWNWSLPCSAMSKNVSVGDKHEIRNNLKMSRGRQK